MLLRKTVLLIVFTLIFCLFPMRTLAVDDQGITPSGITYLELEKEVADYAAEFIGKTTVGASVIVVKDGELVVNKSYGYANFEKQLEVTPDTVFEWGSATKLLVWTSVMQLVEQGKLDLNEDIKTYLPSEFFKKLQSHKPITMLNLMHHDAGWEDKYTDLFYKSAEDIKTLEEMLHITEPYQVNEPGEIVAYSNYGVALAGYIVESITGQPFYDYVNDHIFAVLDMKDTAIHPSQKDNQSVAEKRESVHGYLVKGEGAFSRSKDERVFIGLYPAGSAIGTAEDAAKFIMALMPADGVDSPLFQSNHTLNEMLTTSDFYDNGLPRNAHGFWHGMYAVNVLEHAGNTDSFSSNFTFSQEEKLGVIVLTNQIAESGLSYGLPVVVYGEYDAAKGNENLKDSQELKGNYIQARQAYKGFTKLMGVIMTGKLEVENSHSFSLYGMTFEQVAPYLYRSANEYNLFLHFSMDDGEVKKVSMMTTDLLPVSMKMKTFIIVSLIASVFSILYVLVANILSIIAVIRKRINSSVAKWNALLNLAGLAALVNFSLLAYRAYPYGSYETLTIHFWVFYAFIAFVGVCVVMMIVRWKKASYTTIQKISYILSCVVAILIVGLIIGWELYK